MRASNVIMLVLQAINQKKVVSNVIFLVLKALNQNKGALNVTFLLLWALNRKKRALVFLDIYKAQNNGQQVAGHDDRPNIF